MTLEPVQDATQKNEAAPAAPPLPPSFPDPANLPKGLGALDGVILFAAVAVIAATTVLLFIVLYNQMSNYNNAITVELKNSGHVEHAAILAYARATDFAAAKLSALFLGFLLVFLGAMFVLRVAKVDYGLSVSNGPSQRLSLSSTSPGLIIISLGVILIICVLFSQTHLDYQTPAASIPVHYSADKAD
jgi:hypothetical protein